ncbi:ArsR/SmtB family transcription factor [Halorubrum aethiopicum]|uniref:ArsR/SmtB family transcription factor n=1 Tax=Halorubrum aethiopicum TaxID=1758255 RepID=UPI00083533B4|nr:helix-turn-helix domain-containing protein [Halorubrum aethiopicum]
MSSLFPTDPDASVDRSEEAELLCIDDGRTAEILASLSSERSRAVFRHVNEEPRTATDLARELDTSVQGVTYHLDNLRDAGLIDILDTCYSEKGREMDVYGPSEQPYLVFLGTSSDEPGLRAAFKRFAHAVGPVGILFAIGGALSKVLAGDDG